MSNRPKEYAQGYPLPPTAEPSDERIYAVAHGEVVIETIRPVRVLEKGHPPTYYIPQSDVAMKFLEPSPKRTTCEFKGEAHYYHLVVGEHRVPNAAWYYPEPKPGYEVIAEAVAFYASAFDEATVDGEVVDAQAGRFYGGWINSWVEGPFKGAPAQLKL